MSNLKAEVTVPWAGGEYTFRLTVTGTIELEQKCEAPFTVVFSRLRDGVYTRTDIRETIRLGLIGGGMDAAAASKMVKQHVDDAPVVDSLPLAVLILGGVLFGFEASPPGNPEAAPEGSPSPSTPPPSTATPPSSQGSRLRPLVESRFGSSRQQ